MKIALVTVTRVSLGVVLAVAGFSKLADFGSFVGQMTLYKLIPMSWAPELAYLLVSAQVIAGLLLIVGYHTRGGGLIAGLLLFLFIVALISAWFRQLPLDDCGCHNVLLNWLHLDDRPGWSTVSLDLLLFACCILILLSPSTGYGLDQWFDRDARVVRHKEYA